MWFVQFVSGCIVGSLMTLVFLIALVLILAEHHKKGD